METHLENSIAIVICAIAISVALYQLYANQLYSKTGMILAQAGLWIVAVFMLTTLN
ncbi:hypothetical protein RYZ26_13540 [Terasakiella sp. A23]|uniref:hypothetical protein n=1 Tax=Terasakiella sp. FCG-A23 TaxID=3080561 RepID=UPI00295354B6|nr:hypothetical protein [Terasakiella sp. A23]MDV7340624.1 hypothetical protein [Terasakiella sp. A23]